MTHTPGPWDVQDEHPRGMLDRCVTTTDGYFVATAHDALDGNLDANARLIAAAPELLKSLRDLVEIERRDNLSDPDVSATDWWREEVWSNARAAIAKATTSENVI